MTPKHHFSALLLPYPPRMFMKNRTSPNLAGLTTAALLSLAAFTTNAATSTIFSEDFESYTGPATSLTDTNDCDPVNPLYVVYDDNPLGFTNGAGVQLENFLVHGGSQALLLRSGTEARVSLNNPKSGTHYTLDFWLNVHKAPTGSHSFYVILKGEGADINTDDYVAYRSDRATNSATIWYYDGIANANAGFWANTLAVHLEDTWQHHRLVVDTATQTMSIFVDDMINPVSSNVDISRCEVPVPTVLRIIHEGNSADDGYFAIDDISLTVDDSKDLTTTFTEGFESYPARVLAEDDADPQGPWITVETDGTGTGRALAPGKVQVVDSSVVPAHSGTKCPKLEGGQRAGSTFAWGMPPQSDVQITWWARVPASVDGTTATYLRLSLYGAENGYTFQNNATCDTVGDSALLGYGSRDATIGDDTSLTYFVTAWLDSGVDYTPDTWEQYRLTTHTAQGRYTIVKNPTSANPEIIVDRSPLLGSATNWSPVFMAGWSSSNGTNHPPVYVDDIEIKSLVSNPDPLGQPYTVSLVGNRFTNYTKITTGGTVGSVAVDPRDNATILFTQDSQPGGIYRASKVANGNWAVDPVPVVTGLNLPSGIAVAADGTLWWTHDFTMALSRLKWPWASNTPENVVTNFGAALTDDDPIDLAIAPANFTGTIGQPGMIVVADRGSDGDAFNALNLINPASAADQTNETFLVQPTTGSLGDNVNAITALPASGEVATLSTDGFISAVNGDGVIRYIVPATLWVNPPRSGSAIAADPATGRIWVSDDLLDEVWSIAPDTGADQKEIGFPLVDPLRTERQIDLHDPGMAFAPNGSFMVLTDTSTTSGGGFLYVFHNESLAVPTFAITQYGRVNATTFQLSWASAGGVKYRVQRSTDLGNPAGFSDISADLTETSFTDTNAPAGAAYYRVIAKP